MSFVQTFLKGQNVHMVLLYDYMLESRKETRKWSRLWRMSDCHGIALSCFGVMRMVNSHTYLNINQRLVKLDYTNHHLSNSIRFPVNLFPVQVDRIDRPFSRTFAQRLDLTMICLPKHCTKVNQTFNFTYLIELEKRRRFLSNIKYLIE